MIPDDPIIRSIERRGIPYWMDDYKLYDCDALYDPDEPDEEEEDDDERSD